MTNTDQVIYLVLGGAGLGLFVGAIARWRLRGWGWPRQEQPRGPDKTRGPEKSGDGEEDGEDPPPTPEQVKATEEELRRQEDRRRRQDTHARIAAKQRRLKALAANIPELRHSPK